MYYDIRNVTGLKEGRAENLRTKKIYMLNRTWNQMPWMEWVPPSWHAKLPLNNVVFYLWDFRTSLHTWHMLIYGYGAIHWYHLYRISYARLGLFYSLLVVILSVKSYRNQICSNRSDISPLEPILGKIHRGNSNRPDFNQIGSYSTWNAVGSFVRMWIMTDTTFTWCPRRMRTLFFVYSYVQFSIVSIRTICSQFNIVSVWATCKSLKH